MCLHAVSQFSKDLQAHDEDKNEKSLKIDRTFRDYQHMRVTGHVVTANENRIRENQLQVLDTRIWQ